MIYHGTCESAQRAAPQVYFAQAQRTISESFGGWPCIKMPTRKMRAATHVPPAVHNRMPTSPTQGCHAGTPAGMDWRSSITIGVNGGIRLITVAMAPLGAVITGIMTKKGIMNGVTSTTARFCASCGLLQAAPSAAAKLLSMVT